MKVNINDIIIGMLELKYRGELPQNATIALAALNQLDYRMYETEYTDVDFEYFCDAVEIDQDQLTEAMEVAT